MNKKFCETDINGLLGKTFDCECGRKHRAAVKNCAVYCGAVAELSELAKKYNAESAYIVCDTNTYNAAFEYVRDRLCGLKYRIHIFNGKIKLEPDEAAVGQAVMDYRNEDIIIGIGSGVINDICKFLKKLTGKPFVMVGTAPSMDGYASDSSSMIYGGVKTTIYTCCADELICDINIIKNAPEKMILAGIGDMTAKIVSVCEWRISNLINGEYYCEEIADMMRSAAKKCCDSAEKAVKRDTDAIKTIVEGLILAGIAMSFAEISRPASGVEHYYSHLWGMRAIADNRQSELHGITVGIGTLLALRKYEKLRKIVPSYENARKKVLAFDQAKWEEGVREYFKTSADSVIKLEKKEKKYDPDKHEARIKKIIENWDGILKIIGEELIPSENLYAMFDKLGFPTSLDDIGENEFLANSAFLHTKDIRDKYILSRLSWDLGADGEMMTN